METDLKTVRGIVAAFRAASGILVASHERPDGDAIGSALALHRILRDAGLDAAVAGMLPVPERYAWLPGAAEILPVTAETLARRDLLAALDCGAFDRAPGICALRRPEQTVINIDHHDSNTRFGNLNWVDPCACSTGELVFRLAQAAELRISPAAAQALWVAVSTDTGGFCYGNTSARALRIGAELVELGADPAVAHQRIHQSLSLSELSLTRRALENLELCLDGLAAVTTLTRSDFAEFGCGPEHASEIVNLPRSVKGTGAGLFFYEPTDEEVTKVSVRTVPPLDAAALCALFGGGGHHCAAGCKLPCRAAEAKRTVLAAAARLWRSGGGALPTAAQHD